MVSNIYENCSLCENPYPYKCEECCSLLSNEQQSCIIEEAQVQAIERFYVGSGEDFCQETYVQSMERMFT